MTYVSWFLYQCFSRYRFTLTTVASLAKLQTYMNGKKAVDLWVIILQCIQTIICWFFEL